MKGVLKGVQPPSLSICVTVVLLDSQNPAFQFWGKSTQVMHMHMYIGTSVTYYAQRI